MIKMTRGEAEIAQWIIKFERDYRGRGPEEAHAIFTSAKLCRRAGNGAVKSIHLLEPGANNTRGK